MERGKGSLERLRGAVLAEAAIVMVVLMMVTLGAIQYGWFFYCLHTATNAARQGARIESALGGDGHGTDALQSALSGLSVDPNWIIKAEVTGPFKDPNDLIDPNLVYVQGQVIIDGNSPAVRLLPISFLPVPNCRATVKMAKEGAN